METRLLRLFHRQVAEQCQFVLNALAELNRAEGAMNNAANLGATWESYRDNLGRIQQLDEWGSLHFWQSILSLLTATANLSKLLWGQRDKHAAEREARRAPLRQSLAINDSSPLRATLVRNHFEHVDERLDDWWKKTGGRGLYADRNISDIPIVTPPVDDINMFRSYDPSRNVVSFWGDVFDIGEIVREVQRILPKAMEQAEGRDFDEMTP